MHRTVFSGIGIALIAVSTASAEMKFGYINSEAIFAEYEGTKEAQSKFNNEVAKWEQEASKKQQEIKDLKEQIDKQSLLLSNERKKALEDSLNQKMGNYQKFLQENFGQDGKALTFLDETHGPSPSSKKSTVLSSESPKRRITTIFSTHGRAGSFSRRRYTTSTSVFWKRSTRKNNSAFINYCRDARCFTAGRHR